MFTWSWEMLQRGKCFLCMLQDSSADLQNVHRCYAGAVPTCNLRKQKVQVGNPQSRLVSQTTRMASSVFRGICLSVVERGRGQHSHQFWNHICACTPVKMLICKTPYIHHTHTNKYVYMSDYMYIEQMVKRN